MFKWFHRFAHPEYLYHFLGQCFLWILGIALFGLIFGLGLGLFFAPSDYQQGHAYRIIFLHVPVAAMSLSIYAMMATSAFIGQVWQIKLADLAAISMAPIGAMMTFLALLSGAIWGKPTWGTWWVWDARLTSELILLFLYLGILALYAAFEDKKVACKATALLMIIGVINLPIVKFSVDWWNSLHQPNALTVGKSNAMPIEMLLPLLLSFVGLFFLSIALIIQQYRLEILYRYALKQWVKDVVIKL